MRNRILVVAGDATLRARLARLIRNAGYGVELAEGTAHARRIGIKGFPVAVVAPEGKGLEAELDGLAAKTLILATPGAAPDPGSLDPSDEGGLLARIAEAVRPVPAAEPPEPVLRFGEFRLDFAGHSLTDQAGRDVPLTRFEFILLREFVQHPGRVLSRDHLLTVLAGRDAESYDRSVDMLMVRLRRKIEPNPKRPSLIITVPGSGYKFAAKVTRETAAAPQPSPPVMPERRQLTVMHCALAGPAFAVARRDPEDLQRLLTVFHEHCAAGITQAGGAVDRLLNDGLLAYFGYPQADEHQAERAVRIALRLVETAGRIDTAQLGELQVQIGVATGLAVVGGQTSAPGQPGPLGETASIAAGLASRAGGDSVLISASSRRLVGKLFELRACEPVVVEGLGEPIEVWQVVAEAATESRFEALRGAALAPLVGREEELELLLRRWNQAEASTGKVVLITGEPGIGKSRITRAVQDAILGKPHIELRFFCSPHHQDSALHPFIAQLQHAAGFTRGDTDEVKLAKLDAVLAQSNATDEALALIAELLSIPTDQRERIQQMSPQARRERTLVALLAQFTELAARQPVLLTYEDIHWIDPTSRELLDRTIERMERLPVLLLATFRPEFQPPWIGQPNVTLLALSRLDRHNRAVMIAALAGENGLPGEIAQEIADRTDGVPLFIEEVTRTVIESGARAAEALSAIPHSALSVPATLHASLVARLDRLGPAAKDVAQRGAVIGREFTYELIACIADRSQPELEEALDRLTSAGLLFARGAPPRSTYVFKHALVQDAAYGTMLRSGRKQLHARIATVLDTRFEGLAESQPELLAHHFTEAERIEPAIGYWLKAGEQALARSAMREAEALLRRGLSLLTSLDDGTRLREQELDLRIALGQALLAVQGWGAPAVGETYTRGRRLCDSLGRADKLLPILYGQWVHHLQRADLDRASQFASEIRQLGEASGDAVAQATGCRASGLTCMYLGDFSAARAYLERGLELYNPADLSAYARLSPVDAAVTLLANLSVTLACSGCVERAWERCRAGLAEARRLGHAHTSAYALWAAVVTSWVACSGPADSLRLSNEFLALTDEQGFALYRALAGGHRGWCLAALGRVEEGISLLSTGLVEYRGTGSIVAEAQWLTMLADAHRLARDFQAAFADLDEAERRAEISGARWVQAETLRLRGDLLLQTGARPAAEASYRGAIALAHRQGAKLFELRASTSLARLWRDQERDAEARDLLALICDRFTEGFDAPDLREAKALLDELGGRGGAPNAATRADQSRR